MEDQHVTQTLVLEAALPSAADVRGLLNGLFDRRVSAQEEPGPVLLGRGVHVVGSYVDGADRVVALVLCDLSLGCVLGAALTLAPPSRAHEAVAAGEVPRDLADDTCEVLAVAGSLFSSAQPHLRLRSVQVAPESVPDDVAALLRSDPLRVDLTVEVPGYGAGVMVLLRAATG